MGNPILFALSIIIGSVAQLADQLARVITPVRNCPSDSSQEEYQRIAQKRRSYIYWTANLLGLVIFVAWLFAPGGAGGSFSWKQFLEPKIILLLGVLPLVTVYLIGKVLERIADALGRPKLPKRTTHRRG